jgi:predicted NUDIX family phosphoesterase
LEFVYVVPRSALFPDCYPQGFRPFGAGLTRERFLETVAERGFFVERAHAEISPELKQVIPYGVVVSGERVLLLRRLPRGGEGRLHGKLSIGVGGHVDPVDDSEGTRSSLLARAAERELDEELRFEGPRQAVPVGLLNDDSNPVGAVHLGFVQVVRTAGDVSVRELDVLEGRLVPASDLVSRRRSADFETWSSILVEHVGELLTQTSETTPVCS